MSSELISSCSKIIGIMRSYRHLHPTLSPDGPLPEPQFFIKPPSSLCPSGGVIEVPRGCTVNHEVELAVVIGTGGRDIKLSEAESHISGYALALDCAVKSVLDEAVAAGLPWGLCKGMDTMTPIGRFIPKDKIPQPKDVQLAFQLDGLTRQSGPVSDLIFPIPHLISYISGIFTLHPGDIILTGTPDGVDLLRPGQKVTASMRLGGEVLDTIEMEVVQRQGGFQRVQHWAEGLPR